MSIDAMKQAVEALEYAEFYIKSAAEFGYSNRAVAKHIFSEAIADLRAAIEQSEQRWVKSYAGGKPNYTEPQERKPVAWRKNYQNSGYTYFDERWGTIPDDAEPLFPS